MKLATILDRLEDRGLLADASDSAVRDLEIAGMASDSRAVEKGFLFAAVRGTAADGHDYLGAAAEKGATAALVEEVKSELDLPQVRVTSGRSAAAHGAAAFYGDPWKDLTLIGITGTNGKTTTAAILRHLLSQRGPAASMGTLGMIGPDGKPVPGTEGLTTPGPIQFAEQMRRLADLGVQAVALETSSHALDQGRVDAASFAAGIFTNLTRDHLDYHGTLEAYRAAKLKLADLVRPGGVLAVNADEEAWEGVGREGVHTVRYGVGDRGDVRAENVRFGDGGVEWTLSTPSCTAGVHLPLFGTYNVENALGAAAALWGLGWTADQISEGLATLPQVPGRLERVAGLTAPTILIDYAHTPDALEGALTAIKPLVRGRLIVVFGAGGDRDQGKRPEMGAVAARLADLSIVTTDNPRHEDPETILDQIEEGMRNAPRVRIADRKAAIARAIEVGGADDVVLLAGKGHETYQIWGDERRPFDERAVIADILRERERTN